MSEILTIDSPTLWLPLGAAICFALASVVVKRASFQGVDIWRICFVSNIVTTSCFLPFLLAADTLPPWQVWWQPFLVAVLFMIGQVFTLVAMTHGEISVAAPVLGLKIVFVPFFLSFLQIARLPKTIWLSCLLAAIGIALLNFTERGAKRSRVLFSVICATIGSAAYALFDVCVQQFSADWQQSLFLPCTLLICLVLSIGFVPFFQAPLRSIPRKAWISLLGGTSLFGIQALGIVGAIAYWGNAAAANVVFSTRGLWGLVFIWLLGRSFGIADSSLNYKVFLVRLLGASLLISAVFVILAS